MKPVLLLCVPLITFAQPWSPFIDGSRAIDWTSTVGATIPNYTTNCSVQPTLTANTLSAAAANTTAIEAALASCDATHNVVNIPAGTYYVASWTYGSQGHQVVRGAGPMSTYIYLTATVPCGGLQLGPCMISSGYTYAGDPNVLPPSGTRQCLWSAGYAQGSTSITLSNCGGAPPLNKMIILDQANDTSDTGGVYICDGSITGCNIFGATSFDGRTISGVTHSQVQTVYTTGVSGCGTGCYTVTIFPGVYFNNIRSGQSPGAWWSGFVQNDGIENLTLDHSPTTGDTSIAMYDCYQCWVKNVRSMWEAARHVFVYQSLNDVIRDNYFYQAQSHGSESYGIEVSASSGLLVENNIFQYVTNPLMFMNGSGSVVGYNYSVQEGFGNANAQTSDAGHDAGNGMNLWEGNNFFGIWADIAWGSSSTTTLFRNMLRGWQSGETQYTYVIQLPSWNRAFNNVGNVVGQPGYHVTYESYATSSTGGINGGSAADTAIYALGWSGNSSPAACTTPPVCDPVVRSTLMRWGNYDIANNAVRWDSTEASPSSVPYVNANFTSSYFGSLAHTLPASLYYTSKPSWWPAAKAWPPTGPDVTGGNLGTCSGTYSGAQATASSQCTDGTLTSAWAGHANSIPAQDCFLNTMNGPPDGSGGVLSFDANLCYPTISGSSLRNSTSRNGVMR